VEFRQLLAVLCRARLLLLAGKDFRRRPRLEFGAENAKQKNCCIWTDAIADIGVSGGKISSAIKIHA
jgi:hypothetical protein